MRFADEALRVQAATANGPRRAALMLHSMRPGDRDWLLAQLDQTERGVIGGLLNELRSLGIPKGTGFVEPSDTASTSADATLASIKDVPSTLEAASEAVLEHVLPVGPARLFDVDVDKLARVVADEPSRLTALLLRVHDWPWRDTLLMRLGVAERRQVEAILAEMDHGCFAGVPPKLADALVTDLAMKVATGGATPTLVQVPSTLPTYAPQRAGWGGRALGAMGVKRVIPQS